MTSTPRSLRYVDVKFSPVLDTMMEVLIAELLAMGYESFRETDQTLSAYICRDDFRESGIREVLLKYPELTGISWQSEPLPEKNWNALWESQFKPVLVAEKCYIRAPFHEPIESDKNAPLIDIIIEPKMSFGTAHHETTALMIALMLEYDFTGKRVLDMGCGTGILAILACRLNASEVVAIDNDEWAYQNCLENTLKNNTGSITVFLGDTDTIPEPAYDVILANINRNTLVEQLPAFATRVVDAGWLFISGFYEEDLLLIQETAENNGFMFVGSQVKNQWMVAKFRK